MERQRKKEGEEERRGHGERRVEEVERWAVPAVLTKAAPVLCP